jgi:head-tail adaptor
MFREPLSFDGHRQIKVDIEQMVTSQDSFGAQSTSWTLFAKDVPAAFDSLQGDERYADQQVEGIDRFQVLMRYQRGVNEKMRLTFTNDAAELHASTSTNVKQRATWRNRWLLLAMQVRRVNQGMSDAPPNASREHSPMRSRNRLAPLLHGEGSVRSRARGRAAHGAMRTCVVCYADARASPSSSKTSRRCTCPFARRRAAPPTRPRRW